MAWPMPRVPPVTKIVLLDKENRSFPLALMRIQFLFCEKLLLGHPVPNDLHFAQLRCTLAKYVLLPISVPWASRSA